MAEINTAPIRSKQGNMKEVLERRGKNNSFRLGAGGTGEGSLMEANWHLKGNRILMGKMARRGNGIPGCWNSVSKDTGTRE